MESIYDVIIAGAGFSGVVTASRLHELRPDWQIALVEKEAKAGGRLLSRSAQDKAWSYGLDQLSPALCEWLDQALKSNPESDDLPRFIKGKRRSLGVLASNKIADVSLDEAFGQKGAKAIAGAAAARDWTIVDELMALVGQGKKLDQPLSQSWPGTRKSPSAIVLEHLARLWGIPDLWTVSGQVILEKAREFAAMSALGEWDQALGVVLTAPGLKDCLSASFNSRILSAEYENENWTLTTSQGQLKGKRLVVAQNPWDALLWLPKNLWPSRLIGIPSKVKPSSSVLLSEAIVSEQDLNLPDYVLIPAENVQAVVTPCRSICFQATLNYELTVQAPAVVKAVKRLRRSRKKLLLAYPELQLAGDHIALVPVAWSQPLSVGDRRFLEKVKIEESQAKHLVFCGDAYGPYMHADQNLMLSVRTACETLCHE